MRLITDRVAKVPQFRSELARIAQAAYGPFWQSPRARELDVTLRSVQRWAAGDTAPTQQQWTRIRELCQARARHNLRATLGESQAAKTYRRLAAPTDS